MENPTERLDVRVAPSLKKSLFEKAEEAGVKASDIVRAGIEAVLGKDKSEIRTLLERQPSSRENSRNKLLQNRYTPRRFGGELNRNM